MHIRARRVRWCCAAGGAGLGANPNLIRAKLGGITTVAEPDVPLVEAEARFARLRLDQVRRLFSRLASPDAANPDVAHD